MWLLGHCCAVPPILNPQTLSRHFCAAPAHRFASCPSSWPTVLRAQLRSLPTIAPPNYAAGPQLPRPIAQLAHKPSPTRHQTMANPPQPAPNLPTRFPNFTSHAKILKFTNLLGSLPLSRPPSIPIWFAAGPKCLPTFYLSSEHPPPDLQQAPSVPPTRIAAISAFSRRLQ